MGVALLRPPSLDDEPHLTATVRNRLATRRLPGAGDEVGTEELAALTGALQPVERPYRAYRFKDAAATDAPTASSAIPLQPLQPPRARRQRRGWTLPLRRPQLPRLALRASALDLDSLSLRLIPHALVIGFAVVAIVAGGFRRPDTTLTALMTIGTSHGDLSTMGRSLLGPRAAEVQAPDSLVRPVLPTTSLSSYRPRGEITTYTVKPGDTIWEIGARFNVGAYSVLWSNGLNEDDIIKPGQQLEIPPVPGALHTVEADDTLEGIAKKYSVDPSVILDFNGLKPDEALTPDKELIIPGGQLPIIRRPVPVPLPPVISAPQTQTQTQRPSTPVQQQPARPAVPAPAPRPAPAPAPAAPTGRFSWPARGLITTYFSWWHSGIDIAAALGTPIGAADGGTVTFTGWDNTGYGYRIVVDHGNGYRTTYNHLSQINVRPGQGVGKGQIIALMGSTGNSTGPHLHFEVLRSGSFINPLGVLG